MAQHAGIAPEQSAEAVKLAVSRGGDSGGTDDFVVTRKFDAIATHADKLALVDALFAISACGRLDVTIEDNEIRRIANELKSSTLIHRDPRRHLKHLRSPAQSKGGGRRGDALSAAKAARYEGRGTGRRRYEAARCCAVQHAERLPYQWKHGASSICRSSWRRLWRPAQPLPSSPESGPGRVFARGVRPHGSAPRSAPHNSRRAKRFMDDANAELLRLGSHPIAPLVQGTYITPDTRRLPHRPTKSS